MQIENATIHWCKLLGSPVAGYNDEGLEWSVELGLDNATVDGTPAIEALKSAGLGSRIKTDEGPKGNFIRLKKNAILKDGGPAKPIPVVDGKVQPWNQDTLIGNGSVANVNVMLDEYGTGKAKKVTVKLMGVQVVKLVPYAGRSSFKDQGATVTAEAEASW